MSENLSREQWGQRGWKSVEITTRGLFLPIVLPDQESGARTLPRTSSVPPRRLRGKRSKVPLLFSRRKRFEKGRSQFCRWIELCRSIIYGELIFSASPSASKHFSKVENSRYFVRCFIRKIQKILGLQEEKKNTTLDRRQSRVFRDGTIVKISSKRSYCFFLFVKESRDQRNAFTFFLLLGSK